MCLHGQHVGCLHFAIFCVDIKVAGDPPALLRPEVEYHGGLVFWGVHLSLTSHSKQMGRDSVARDSLAGSGFTWEYLNRISQADL